MPKIAAATVKEHRAAVMTRLVDAAEAILRADGTGPLTAGVVAGEAGIARNSIYRYVDSVDDLRGLVLRRYLPIWEANVAADLAPVTDPRERVLVWLRANLHQAAENGHGWLVRVARAGRSRPAGGDPEIEAVHRQVNEFLRDSLAETGLSDVAVRAEMVRSIVEAGFRCVDRGDAVADVERWALVAVAAVLAPEAPQA